MPSGAPTNAEYLLLTANSSLPQARTLVVSALLDFIDNGPAADFEILLDQANLVLANLPDLAADISGLYLPQSLLSANGQLITRVAGSPTALAIGSTGQVLTVSGGLPSWATPTVTPAPPASPALVTGSFYRGAQVNGGGTTTSITLNTLYLVPFVLGATATFDRIVCGKGAAGAANYHLGIYGPVTTTWASRPLILDSGQIAMSGAGQISATINQQLAAGVYLLAILTDTTATVSSQDDSNIFGLLGASTHNTDGYSAFVDSQSYGNLPSNSPASPTPTVINAPQISLRVA